jgi:hypothetical protein
MLDFEVQRCTRRCHKTSRELHPGETFYSALVAEGTAVVRLDFAAEAWEGPPEQAIGWWRAKMPDPQARRVHWAPNDVMLHYFQQLEGRPDQADMRYVLALLMIRRRIVRLEDTDQDPAGRELLVVFCPRNEVEYRVPVVTPDPQRAQQIQDELAQMLFADAA